MPNNSTTVLVLGGGPAGGAAALELAQAGCSVVLLERQAKPGWKIGESLPPEASVHLRRLRLWDDFRNGGHRPCYGIVSCWGSSTPVEVDFLRNPYGNGWQLDRARFEQDLLQAARNAGCQLVLGTEVREVQFQTDKWLIETTTGSFQADWLLDCTGRKGILAAQGLAGSFEPLQDYVSLYCLVESADRNDHDARTYVESYPTGWAYSALMPNGTRIVAFLTDGDLIPAGTSPADWMREWIKEGPQIQRLLKEHAYQPIEDVHVISATSGRYQKFTGPQWILVGDAAMTFDPLSGWGSTKAIVSAASAVQTVLNGRDYQAVNEELWKTYLSQYREYYLAEQRWPDSPFWSRRHSHIDGPSQAE